MQYRTRVPVLPDVAARILRTARRDENSCLVSPLTPSQKRPCVKVGGADVKASRVAMAAIIDRPIKADEDVHHDKCRNVRCVEPTHLVVIPTADHQAHHAQARRLELCPRHGTPLRRRDGWGYQCRQCATEATARYRATHPRPPLTDEQRQRRNERDRLRRATPEGRAREKAKRQRKKARAAADSAA